LTEKDVTDEVRKTEIKERLAALRREMASRGIDAYYIPSTDPHLSEYVGERFKAREFISGFTGSAGTAVVTREEAALFTDGRYFIQAARQLEGTGFTLHRIGEPGVTPCPEYVAKLLPEKGVLGFDGRVVSVESALEIREKAGGKAFDIKSGEDLVDLIWRDRPAQVLTEAFTLPAALTGAGFGDKLARIREKMREKGCDYHVVASLDDIAWIFNLRGHDVRNNPVNLAYAAFTPARAILYIDEHKLTPAVKDELLKNHIVLRDYEDIYREIEEIEGKTVLLDKAKINYRIYEALREKNRVIFAENPSFLMKACKNETELAHIREAHLRDGVACTLFLHWLKEEIIAKGLTESLTEIDIAEKLESFRKAQKDYVEPSFNTIAAVGENAAMMHYRADPAHPVPLVSGKLLLIDSGGQYPDGTTDITRTFALGRVDQKLKTHTTLVLKGMLSLAKAKFLHGVTGTSLDVLAREPMWKEGIDYKCGTGHGIGFFLNVHEGPQRIATSWNPQVLEEGMIITDEPGIYIENSHGIRIENELVVRKAEKTEFGQFMTFETLTFAPIDLDCVIPELLSPEERDFLNAYHADVYGKIAPRLPEELRPWLAKVTRSV
jgi:Xaa-Pro aminopeptidase